MIKIIEKNIADNIIKELLKVDNIDDFRTSIYKVEYKGREIYSFPFFDENNILSKHILIHKNYRKLINLKKSNSYWINKSKVFYPEYLLISDRPEEIIKYVSKKNYIFKKTNFVCFATNIFNEETFDYLNKNFRYQKVITIFSKSRMKDLYKLKTTFLLNDTNIDFTKTDKSYLISSQKKSFILREIKYPYIRNRLKLKFKFPIQHK